MKSKLDRGQRLHAAFLDVAWPRKTRVDIEWIEPTTALEMMWARAKPVHDAADACRTAWTPAAVDEVDVMLSDLAATGSVDLAASGTAAIELDRRWKYALTILALEDYASGPGRIPVPQEAPPAVKETAVLLYLLGGIARDYPPL